MKLKNVVDQFVRRERSTSEHLDRTELDLTGRKPQGFVDRLLLPLAIGLGAVVVVLGIYQWLLGQQQTKVQSVANSELLFIKNKTESELRSRISILEYLAKLLNVKRPHLEEWESNTALVMSASPGLNAAA